MRTLMRLECMHCGSKWFAENISMPCPTCSDDRNRFHSTVFLHDLTTLEIPMKTPEPPVTERPKSANAVLRSLGDDHDYIKDPIDMTTTGGIQRAIERNWQAIQALADYVDGVVRGPDGVVRDKNGHPVAA